MKQILGITLATALLLALAVVPAQSKGGDYPTIGGQPVPYGLHCEEDEGIMFVGIPDTLVCQTIDDLFEGR